MSILSIHKNIQEKLDYFINVHQIPNIVFHGSSGTGKKTLLENFIGNIYGHDKDVIKKFVIYVNCSHGKGIKFIREELKFFAKTHIYSNGGDIFKSIVLLNADKLTMDAQSALRRCIELFSTSTRFFIVVEDKYKLLKPILSRFCEIYVPDPLCKNKPINLYKHNVEETFKLNIHKRKRKEWLKKTLSNSVLQEIQEKIDMSNLLYEKGYTALNIVELLENGYLCANTSQEKRYELLMAFLKAKKELRNEKLLIFFLLNFVITDTTSSLENISFI
jgi:DNA polymerase III delta prime subunit